PADLARAAPGVVRAAPAEVLDDLRHVGADDAVLETVPARVAGEVLADLNKLPARGRDEGQLHQHGHQDAGPEAHRVTLAQIRADGFTGPKGFLAARFASGAGHCTGTLTPFLRRRERGTWPRRRDGV